MTERPLKILLTDPHLSGGGQVRYVANLAREFTRMGHAVTIGCKPGSVLVERAHEAPCPVIDRFPFRGGLRFRAWRNDLREARRFIQNEQPDLLHASGSQDHWTCAVANRLLGRPACMIRTRHNTYPVHNGLTNRTLNLKWTDYQIVVCETVRQGLAQQPTFDAGRMCTIHNGVDAEQYHADPAARQRARQELGYTGEHVVCGMAARLVVDKGHEFLFRATAKLLKDVPNLRLLVLGHGKLEAHLKQLAGELGIGKIVNFAGYRNDMDYVMQAFDIGLLPSIGCEASSFSLMEQMATERPMIVSNHGGSKEIVRDDIDGYVVPAATIDPLETALRKLATSSAARTEMGRSARQRVLSDFTVRVFAQRTLEAYARALAIHCEREQAR